MIMDGKTSKLPSLDVSQFSHLFRSEMMINSSESHHGNKRDIVNKSVANVHSHMMGKFDVAKQLIIIQPGKETEILLLW